IIHTGHVSLCMEAIHCKFPMCLFLLYCSTMFISCHVNWGICIGCAYVIKPVTVPVLMVLLLFLRILGVPKKLRGETRGCISVRERNKEREERNKKNKRKRTRNVPRGPGWKSREIREKRNKQTNKKPHTHTHTPLTEDPNTNPREASPEIAKSPP
ncbi:hypothetical protein, partial [Salmonella sp. s58784]|uniref:hypothetical protein n=1 Tax=Salmonella sp. s58784 TaxID=3159709 RepID=UPI0039810BD2